MSSVSLAERIHFRSANIVVLFTVDDVDGGDGLREWEFIYTALLFILQHWGSCPCNPICMHSPLNDVYAELLSFYLSFQRCFEVDIAIQRVTSSLRQLPWTHNVTKMLLDWIFGHLCFYSISFPVSSVRYWLTSFWQVLRDITKRHWDVKALFRSITLFCQSVCLKGSMKKTKNVKMTSLVAFLFVNLSWILLKSGSRLKNLSFVTLCKYDQGVSSAYRLWKLPWNVALKQNSWLQEIPQ